MNILVTGGCGFIGSNFIRLALKGRKDLRITNLDALTYAGNPENLRDVEKDSRYRFRRGAIEDGPLVDDLVKSGFDAIVNFAAESHVDRSLYGPAEFVKTNIHGTLTLLEAAKRHKVKRFLQTSGARVAGKQGWTDVARFTALGVPAFNYGPGIPDLCHRADEYCPIANLGGAYENLAAFLDRESA